MPNNSTATLTPGRELNALIAEKVMGWVVAHYTASSLGIVTGRVVGFNPATANYYELPNGDNPDGIKRSDISSDWSHWSPSTDIAAAWTVVEKLNAQWYCELRVTSDGFSAEFDNLSQSHHACVDPREGGMPLAICLAALKAVESSHV